MNSKAILFATALLLTVSAVSCGNDESEDSTVSISLSEEKTTENSTEDSTEETETEITSDTTTTTSSTEESGTETNTSTDTEVTTTTTAVTTVAEVPQPEETTPPEQVEQPVENVDENQEENNNQPENNNDNGNENQPEEPQQEEVKFNIDQLLTDASEIVSRLGTPVYEGGGAACLTNGHDDKIYQYDGLEIQCYVDGDTEYIFQIEITGGNYQTDKGIKIGSTRADVESAYGTGTESGNMIIYSSGNNEMDIQYDGDIVTTIFFYTPV